ncbi:AAA family ATPase [Aeromonas rivipollensis]|uniref:AAA family ATPase n=2 Tax=Aeromonas rivipollensis TaxID=948519 RepID=UPI0038EF120D
MKNYNEDKNERNYFNVYFCRSDIPQNSFSRPAILLSPRNSSWKNNNNWDKNSFSWNDFKYRCIYDYKIIEYNEREIEGSLFLGFVSKDSRIEADGQLSPDIDITRAEELPKFFTLQGEMQDYRFLVNKHGIKKSNTILLALNDLVASKRISQRTKFINDAIKTDVFRLAFMRESGRFFAYHNADYILDGLEDESYSRISTKLSLNYELAGFYEKHSFNMNFDIESILPKRISVLIGQNGIGKSQALHTIVTSLTKGDNNFYDSNFGGRPIINRLLAIATPGETTNTFPPERANKRIKYRRLILNRNSRSKSSRGFCDLCIQLLRSEESIGSKYRWDLFKESINFLPNIENIVIPLNQDISVNAPHVFSIRDKIYVPLLKINHGGEQAKLEIQGAIINNANPMLHINGEVFPLSSGQLAFIKFVVQACLFIENGTLVLLDEPETHLHPNFITKFIRTLDQLLKLTGSIAIIATHSAYFVREVPRTQVLVFKEDSNGHVNIQNPRLKTFGADVGSISYFVFEDEITNALVDDLIDSFQTKIKNKAAYLKDLESELSSDILMYLRRKLNIEVTDEGN